MRVCVFVPGQVVQQGLELLTDDVDHAALDGVVGHVDEEDEGGRLRELVVLSRNAGGIGISRLARTI